MQLQQDEIYHIYNQGNNKQLIFFQEKNYHYFLNQINKFVKPYCNIIAYCLMPNHFHFLVQTNSFGTDKIKHGNIEITNLSNGFRRLQSSYAQAINKQENRTGSLFRQNTKSKLIAGHSNDYLFTCFNYIHQNPLKAGLVSKMEDWEFSSFNEYLKRSNSSICSTETAEKYLNISIDTFYKDAYQIIDEGKMKNIF
ncbi:MAG: hypothetical protein U0U67_14735 [Chitinophagales bacterium]